MHLWSLAVRRKSTLLISLGSRLVISCNVPSSSDNFILPCITTLPLTISFPLSGSYENEVLAADYIRRELERIKQTSDPAHRLTIDVQKPRGSFNLKFVDGMTHHYRNIQNIIVKLESGHGAKDALLVNCHFDSVPMSPGSHFSFTV